MLFLCFCYLIFLSKNYKTNIKEPIKIEITKTANIDSVINILNKYGEFSNLFGKQSFLYMSSIRKYNNNIISGTIILNPGDKYNNYDLVNKLRKTQRTTKTIQIPENIRKINTLLQTLDSVLEFKVNTLTNYIDTSDFLLRNNLTIFNFPTIFIPNTYEIYDNISPQLFLQKMISENKKFWNEKRLDKCDSLGLTKIQVSILASIVEEEQDNKIDERPRIAGLYINRLNNTRKFPYLQADPTVIFANNDFNIKQVLNIHLEIKSPYNTYKNKGLPPGPIRISSINSIDAVLNAENHNYYFMCAGSDGSGYHEFTSSINEHNKNKVKYKKYQEFN